MFSSPRPEDAASQGSSGSTAIAASSSNDAAAAGAKHEMSKEQSHFWEPAVADTRKGTLKQLLMGMTLITRELFRHARGVSPASCSSFSLNLHARSRAVDSSAHLLGLQLLAHAISQPVDGPGREFRGSGWSSWSADHGNGRTGEPMLRLFASVCCSLLTIFHVRPMCRRCGRTLASSSGLHQTSRTA